MQLLLLVAVITELSAVVTETEQWDPAGDQTLLFKNKTNGPIGMLTTSGGAPVSYEDATNTLNTPLIHNEFFMDTITHRVRENIPPRPVHAKGTGAFGYFEVTHDISHVCKAAFLKKIGTKTPVAVRFSTGEGERGSSDLNRDSRGFAVKFYTEEGNLDLLGFHTPVYPYKDPLNAGTRWHGTKRNPASNLYDFNTYWDVVTLIPEMINFYLLLYSDGGIPASYRNMPGYPIHTYQVENENGDEHFVRFHILPDAGIKNLRSEEARNLSAIDPDYLRRDLYRAIGNGDFPSWTVSVQILSTADVNKVGSQVFDVTRTIPLKEFPLHPIGKIVVNRNAKNFFAEIEQLAFCPANLVPGILGAPDKLFEARRLAYRDSHLYRLGANVKKIPVNCPFQTKTFTYLRDGVPPVGNNEEDAPNYYPNSFNGPVPYMPKHKSALINIVEGKADNFDQAAEFYANELTNDERTRLIENLVLPLQNVHKFIQERAINIFTTIHPDLGNRLAQALNSAS
ncbi:catalase-like [Maniola jurtina]|uniref:catalase-like n=1 Tax=Maniola jurtina TaxID=191418 RepID=UPI001E68F60B|nr:catalase-like [Maniola jurtina]